jgi:ribosomal protein S18 acetylase RimI-like enzyme
MIYYKEGMRDVTRAAIMRLYTSVGWSKYTEKPDKLMNSLAHSSYILLCYDGDRLIGLIRSLTDDGAVNYIQDILVDPEYQRRGIGRELMSRCLNKFDHVRTHILLTDDEERLKLYYESMGFHNTKKLKKYPLNCFVKMDGIDLE